MNSLNKFTLGSLLATALFVTAAHAATISSKEALVQSVIARPATAAVAVKRVDAAAISSKTSKTGAAGQVAVSRTTTCTKTMDMASNQCAMHCR